MNSFRVKQSFACSSVKNYGVNKNLTSHYLPQMGDVALFRVIDPCDNYLADTNGVNRHLYEGDVVMLAFGNRYATNQVEGYVPQVALEEYRLLSRGGVVGQARSWNAKMRNEPAKLELLAYATDSSGKVINTIKKYAMRPFAPVLLHSKVILSIGSSMDSGKTTTAAYLCGGLALAGYTTAYIKLTGTAFPKDARCAEDRGAHFVSDFTHYGFPSTFGCSHGELLSLFQSLVEDAEDAVDPDYIVMEIADGILQQETAALLKDPHFMAAIHGVIYSCGDSLSALSSVQILESWGIRPFALSGLFTASNLLVQEVASELDIPILNLEQLLQNEALPLLHRESLVMESIRERA